MDCSVTQTYSGKVCIITGPMFSGKSKTLLDKIKASRVLGLKCMIISPKKDVRYSAHTEELKVLTHDGDSCACKICEDLAEIPLDSVLDVDVIGIDEAHFFPNVSTHCDFFANLGKLVIVTFPSGSFERKTFKETRDLFAIAEDVKFLKASCKACDGNHKATFTRRIGSNKNEIAVGGTEMYEAVCRKCYFKAQKKVHVPAWGQDYDYAARPAKIEKSWLWNMLFGPN